jgi:hypothetical protein
MINTTRWSPDTCGCVLEYSWDTESPPATRIHTAHIVHQACPFHAAADKDAHLAAVTTENQHKNRANAVLTRHLGPRHYPFSFDPARRLAFRVPATTPTATLTALTQELTLDFPTVDLTF